MKIKNGLARNGKQLGGFCWLEMMHNITMHAVLVTYSHFFIGFGVMGVFVKIY